ncbi:GTPase HflX [Mycoplasmatota bacterium]|nr:GTPase HflX [Mycoplasmatota bacterium]
MNVNNEKKYERTLLVGTYTNDEEEFIYSMEELENLAISCELNVIGQITQKLRTITAATYLGSGKVDEIKQFVEANDIEMVAFNDDLSTSQTRNIQEIIGCQIIDRTLLILDIFARRAKTKEAMLQVEIAQLKYILPRISIMRGNFNERLGTRGPGETKYELDRRKIEKQISLLEQELSTMVSNRQVQRRRRNKNEIPIVSLVGYTNSGKSTLMNTLLDYSIVKNDDKRVVAQDLLFATLETTTRQIVLESKKKLLLTDTVGFVSRLPHQLVKAFRSTLEEITEADLILHVIDLSNKDYERQLEVTEKVLKEIGVTGIPIIHVYNKIDKFDSLNVGDGVFISAKNKSNIDHLLNETSKILFKNYKTVKMLIPYASGYIFNYLKENANVIRESYIDEGIDVTVELSDILFQKYKHLIR